MSDTALETAAERTDGDFHIASAQDARRHLIGLRWRRFACNRFAVWALVLLGILVSLALFAPWLTPADPNAQDLVARLEGLSREAWLGTDLFGRDHLSRLIYGSRVSLVAALTAVSTATLLGVPSGLLAGYAGGRVDAVFNWFMNVLMSMPALVVAITIVAVLGRGLLNAMLAVGIAFTPRFFRVTRAQSRVISSETFIEASRSIGAKPSWIAAYHILPNALSPVLVQMSLALGAAVTAEASLSFIGLGVAPPTASWGSMLRQGAGVMETAPLLVIAPGIMISMTVLAFSLVGDGLREAMGSGRSSQLDVQGPG